MIWSSTLKLLPRRVIPKVLIDEPMRQKLLIDMHDPMKMLSKVLIMPPVRELEKMLIALPRRAKLLRLIVLPKFVLSRIDSDDPSLTMP
jgi:hypothetical protein